jgi:hypothetical protein
MGGQWEEGHQHGRYLDCTSSSSAIRMCRLCWTLIHNSKSGRTSAPTNAVRTYADPFVLVPAFAHTGRSTTSICSYRRINNQHFPNTRRLNNHYSACRLMRNQLAIFGPPCRTWMGELEMKDKETDAGCQSPASNDPQPHPTPKGIKWDPMAPPIA